MTATRPLPPALRSELEDAFGAGFAGVRVHESALAGPRACARGEDVHFAPGAYDPSTPTGREVLAHELAHVLQQRFGRVRRGARRALEVEAAEAGHRFAEGRPVRILGRPGGRTTPATQYYTVIAPANRMAHGLAVVNAATTVPTNAQDSFIGQRKGGAGAMNPRSFRLAGGAVNLVSANHAGATLRLSANGNMAIEDADLGQRQPKVFYATQAIIDASNDRLALLGSSFRLDTDPPGGNQRRITVGAQNLLRVMARNLSAVSAGLTMVSLEHCNAMFDAVAGPTAPHGPQPVFIAQLLPAPHQLLEYHVARELLAPKPAVLDMTTPVTTGNTMRAIAVPYAVAARGAAAGFIADLQQYGLNEYAAPHVGEGFVTCSLVAAAPGAGVGAGGMPATYEDHLHLAGAGGPQVVQHGRSWTSHYGAVVVRDGADVVTLENYARNVEDGNMLPAEYRHYFQMYDTNPPAGGARSWHHAWSNTPMQVIAGGAGPATHEPVSPGARGFTNPLTMRVSVPDSRYDAVAAVAHGGAVLNTIKGHHNLIAGAPDAHQELLHVLKGLYYANTRLAANEPGQAARVQAWRVATHTAYGAARFGANLQAISHTYGRLVQVRTD